MQAEQTYPYWMMNKKRLFVVLAGALAVMASSAQDQQKKATQPADSVALKGVTVNGKSQTQRLREGAFAVNAVDVRAVASSITSLNRLVDRTAGITIREEGGMGSEFDLSINGMSGNSVRYFIDGMPLDIKGSGATLANLPIALIDHVEIYKGVVPTHLSSDALGGAVNIVSTRKLSNYLDASYALGSFHTHQADLNAQYVMKNGLILRPTLGVNYSKNDYMMKDVEVWNEDALKYLPSERRRFHDGYLSLLAQLEAGVRNRWWADEFMVHVSFDHTDKELQTGQVQSRVIGMATRKNHAWGVGAHYQKHHFLLNGLNASFALSHTWDHTVATDTARRQYDWNGNYIVSSRNEINGRAHTLRHLKRPLTTARADLKYMFSQQHLLNLSYALNRTGNDRWDEVDANFEPANDVLAKHIIGLSYNQMLFSGRMSNTFFLKDYINYLWVEQTDLPFITGSREKVGANVQNSMGGGVGTKMEFLPQLAAKASYEHSVRLPLARELLGNGTTIYANTALQPEKSDNLNLGIFGTLRLNEHTLYYEANGFLRFVDNYIQPQITEKEGMMQYTNEPAVHIKGVEGELRYNYRQRLQVMGNMSWQDARNRQRYKTDGKPSVIFNDRVPNRPWLFAAAQVRFDLGKEAARLLPTTSHLYVSADYQWVHWFFLSWESYGRRDTKARIPEKNIVSANLTYSWLNDRYSIALDCQNLFDQTVYDNYKLQKPGRSLFLKFRLVLQ